MFPKEDAPNMPKGDIEQYFSDVDYLETWEAMEEVQKLGLAKSIGVSNFNSEQISRLIANSKVKPAVNQVFSLHETLFKKFSILLPL